jgi:16S rRNA (cytosine967-C5)-methyltransferase
VALVQHAEEFPEVFTNEVQVAGLSERDAKLAYAIVEAAVARWLTIGVLCEKALGRPWSHVDVGPKAALLCGCAQLLHLRRVPSFAAVHDTVAATKDLFGQGVAGFVNAGLRGVLRLLEIDNPQIGRPRDNGPSGMGGQQGHDDSEPRVLTLEAIRAMDAAQRERMKPLLLTRGDGSALVLREPVFAPDPVQHAAALGGVPEGLARKWTMHHSPQVACELCIHALSEAPITLNVQHVAPTVVAQALQGGVLVQHAMPGHAGLAEQLHSAPEGEAAAPIVVPITKYLSELPGAFVQDAASGVPVRFAHDVLAKHGLLPTSHDLVVDLCAGNGTKTRQMIGVFTQAGSLIATDPDRPRFETLMRLPAELAGLQARGALLPQPGRLMVQQFENVRGMGEQAGLVLLDVPCSNTGVLPRRPEARVRWLSRTQESRLVELQRTILRSGTGLVRKGGIVLYATCSLEEEENQAQIAWAQKNLGLTLLGMEATLPVGQPGDAPTNYRDASFAAVLRKG